MKRLLCWFGLHDTATYPLRVWMNPDIMGDDRPCSWCGKVKR